MSKSNRKINLIALFFFLILSINCNLLSNGEPLFATQTAIEATNVAVASTLTSRAETASFVPNTLTPTMTLIPKPSNTPTQTATQTPSGPVAYEFCLTSFDEETICLHEYQGRLVVLTFFSNNCPYCRMEAPIIEKMYTKYRSKGLIVFGIVPSEVGKSAIKRYIDAYSFTFPVLLDKQYKISNKYSLGGTGVPRSFFINQFGYIASIHIGAMPEADWEHYILRDLPEMTQLNGHQFILGSQ